MKWVEKLCDVWGLYKSRIDDKTPYKLLFCYVMALLCMVVGVVNILLSTWVVWFKIVVVCIVLMFIVFACYMNGFLFRKRKDKRERS